jgi:hypothetical protein
VRVCASRRGDVGGATLVGMTGLAWEQTWIQGGSRVTSRALATVGQSLGISALRKKRFCR